MLGVSVVYFLFPKFVLNTFHFLQNTTFNISPHHRNRARSPTQYSLNHGTSRLDCRVDG